MAVVRRDYVYEKDKSLKGDTVWSYDFSYHRHRFRQSGFRTKAEAELAEQKVRTEVMFEGRLPATRREIAFDEAVELLIKNRYAVRAERNAKREEIRSRQLLKVFKKRPLSTITVADVQNYQTTRIKQGMAPRTINLEMTLLRCVFKLAQERGLVSSNPAKSVPNLRVPSSERPVPSDEELQRFIDEVERTCAGRQLVTWLWLEAYTGMRPSEAFHLEWSDIDFKKDIIHIRPKDDNPLKTGPRWVEIHPELRQRLAEWKMRWQSVFRDKRIHDWVFFHPRQTYRRACGFGRSFKQAKEGAKLEYLSMYHLRHYFISRAIESGVSTETISKWCGTSAKMINKVYSHLSPEFRTGEMDKIVIGGKKDTHQTEQTAS